MPNTPTIASTSARPAKATTSTARKRCDEVASRATSSSVMRRADAHQLRRVDAADGGAHRRRQGRRVAGRRAHQQEGVVEPGLGHRHVDLHEVLGLVGPALHLAGHADDLAHDRLSAAARWPASARRAGRSGLRPPRCRRTNASFTMQTERALADVAVGGTRGRRRPADRSCRSRRRSRSGSRPPAAGCRRAARRRRSRTARWPAYEGPSGSVLAQATPRTPGTAATSRATSS